MKKIDLSETEKRVLKELCVSQYPKDNMFGDLSREALYVASNRLKECGLIHAHYEEGNILGVAIISDEGKVYLQENPNLDNPFDEEELKRLQKDELEHKQRIRTQESIIRYWQLLTAIIGIIAIVGWLLLFLL